MLNVWFQLLLHLGVASSAFVDLLAKKEVDFNWIEVGSINAEAFSYNNNWVKVTTRNKFDGDPLVFLSVPDVADILNAPWYPQARGPSLIPPIVPKVEELPVQNPDGTYSFQFKLVTVNDSFCSKEWYDAFYVPPGQSFIEIAWLMAQAGAYGLSGVYDDDPRNLNFVISSGNITRASASPTATSSNGNAIQMFYPTGCINASELCIVNEFSMGLQQLQTSRNTVDNGKDLFLSVRAWSILKRSAWFVLVPHDSVNSTYFEISTPEVLAYMIVPTNQVIVCSEGFVVETRTFDDVTHVPVPLSFAMTYDYIPAIFGMLGSVFSMVDSTTLSVYNTSQSSAVFITKEDQCVSEPIVHTTPEIVHMLIIAQSRSASMEALTVCKIDYEPPPQEEECVSVIQKQ